MTKSELVVLLLYAACAAAYMARKACKRLFSPGHRMAATGLRERSRVWPAGVDV